MKRLSLIWFVLGLAVSLFGQTPTCYRVYLSDKNNSPYSINNPLEYLSQRAIDKRTRFNIPITEQDFPINPQYKQQILALDSLMQPLAVSKWMNTFTVYCPDSTVVPQILDLPFVDSILAVGNYDLQAPSETQSLEPRLPMVYNFDSETKNESDYGEGFTQIAMHNGHLLHEEGFRGEGMLIVVIDNGWVGIDGLSYYQELVSSNRFLGKYSLVPDCYGEGWHGASVTSVMAANSVGSMIGTAPAANYAFIQSENPDSEELIEEDFWANAAEIADSLGADVVTSSLYYYSSPDFPQANFTFTELDGTHSIASRCATTLVEKGVVVSVCAGNEGSFSWYYIGHPADAFDILCVGGCYADSIHDEYSSHGYTADGRVKPDVTAMSRDVMTYGFTPNGSEGPWTSNGTSYATPIIGGLSACLWQAMPQYTSSEIMQIVRESGHLYNNPDADFGYGIPDFYKAYTTHVGINDYKPLRLSVYPNPATDKLFLTNHDGDIRSISIYNAAGQLVLQHAVNGNPLIEINVTSLPKGFYVGTATMESNRTATFKFVK